MLPHHKSQYFPESTRWGRPFLPALFVGCTLLCVSGRAGAQDPYHCIDELSDEAVSYRIRSIEESFARGRYKALGWRIGWIGGYASLTAIQAAQAVDARNNNRPWDRFAFMYQAIGSAALTIGLAVIPAPDLWGGKRIRKRAAATAEERRDKLRYATRLFERGAAVEDLMSHGELIALGAVYGVVGGTVKAVKWTGRSPGNTALLFIVPPALATGTVLSAPRHLVEDWEGYRAIACSDAYYDRGPEGPDFDWSISPTGVRFSIEF
jgi:hypothetical protein